MTDRWQRELCFLISSKENKHFVKVTCLWKKRYRERLKKLGRKVKNVERQREKHMERQRDKTPKKIVCFLISAKEIKHFC